MLYSNNFLLLITKSARLTDHSSTLIDDIYTNAPILVRQIGARIVGFMVKAPKFAQR